LWWYDRKSRGVFLEHHRFVFTIRCLSDFGTDGFLYYYTLLEKTQKV